MTLTNMLESLGLRVVTRWRDKDMTLIVETRERDLSAAVEKAAQIAEPFAVLAFAGMTGSTNTEQRPQLTWRGQVRATLTLAFVPGLAEPPGPVIEWAQINLDALHPAPVDTDAPRGPAWTVVSLDPLPEGGPADGWQLQLTTAVALRQQP